MRRKVSIVVPIYNVESYLEKCIKSITNQTYNDLEIILVDDGSTDDSPSICDKWKELDKRVVVIHKENGGLSSARNAGLEIATGDYIMFEDSDDWLQNDIVERCINRIEEKQADVVIFGYSKVDENGKSLGTLSFGNGNYTNEEMSHQLHKRILEMSFGYAWNKLYKLSTIKASGIINDGSIIDREDLYFNLSLFKYLNNISYLDYAGYYYLQRGNSLLHNADLRRLTNINVFCDKMKSIKWGDEQSEKEVFNMNILHYLSDCLIKNIIWNKDLTKKEKSSWMNKVIEDCNSTDTLYLDSKNPKHLNILCKGIKKRNLKYFYYYVKLSDLKRRFL